MCRRRFGLKPVSPVLVIHRVALEGVFATIDLYAENRSLTDMCYRHRLAAMFPPPASGPIACEMGRAEQIALSGCSFVPDIPRTCVMVISPVIGAVDIQRGRIDPHLFVWLQELAGPGRRIRADFRARRSFVLAKKGGPS